MRPAQDSCCQKESQVLSSHDEIKGQIGIKGKTGKVKGYKVVVKMKPKQDAL